MKINKFLITVSAILLFCLQFFTPLFNKVKNYTTYTASPYYCSDKVKISKVTSYDSSKDKFSFDNTTIVFPELFSGMTKLDTLYSDDYRYSYPFSSWGGNDSLLNCKIKNPGQGLWAYKVYSNNLNTSTTPTTIDPEWEKIFSTPPTTDVWGFIHGKYLPTPDFSVMTDDQVNDYLNSLNNFYHQIPPQLRFIKCKDPNIYSYCTLIPVKSIYGTDSSSSYESTLYSYELEKCVKNIESTFQRKQRDYILNTSKFITMYCEDQFKLDYKKYSLVNPSRDSSYIDPYPRYNIQGNLYFKFRNILVLLSSLIFIFSLLFFSYRKINYVK